jgi:hypothetical protein
MNKLSFITLLSITFMNQLSAGAIVSGDSEYLSVDVDSNTHLYFAKENQNAAKSLQNMTPNIVNYYEQSFGYKMDDPLNLILASSTHNQVLNGFSTQIPHNMTMLYGGASLDLDYFSSSSWLKTLATHELAHNFQLNSKNSETGHGAHTLFGNNPTVTIPIIGWPIFIYPNLFLPTFALEGNAVLNESTYDNGGRLYSGELRALTYTHFKDRQFSINKMINTTLDFPYGQTPYIIGGYFHAFLAEKYGVKKVNEFYEENSKSYLFPFLLSSHYRTHFGIGYESLMYLFKRDMLKKTKGMTLLKGISLATSQVNNKMHKDGTNIYFTSTPFADKPTLHIYNLETQKIKQEKRRWLNGKPFLVDNEVYMLSSKQNSPSNITIGLYNKHVDLLESSHSKAIQDIQGEHTLYVDATKSYDKSPLYKDGTFINNTNSTALLDKLGQTYYFKNSGKTRTLYKDQTALFSYEGYWGFPVDIVDTKVYFVAPTLYGSSLFCFDIANNKSFRISNADNIIDAKMVDDNTFIATTVRGKSYESIKASITFIEEAPYEIRYSFEQSAKVNLNQNSAPLHEHESVNEISDLHFSALNPSIDIVDNETIYNLNLSFSDKLLSNSLNFGYHNSNLFEMTNIAYDNSRHLLNFGASVFNVSKDRTVNTFASGTSTLNTLGAYGILNYPISQTGDDTSSLSLEGYTDYQDEYNNPLILSYNYRYARAFGQAVRPEDYLSYTLYAKAEDKHFHPTSSEATESVIGGSVIKSGGFGDEFYFDIGLQTSYSNQGNGVTLDDNLAFNLDKTNFKLYSLDFNHYAQHISSQKIALAKTTYASFYSTWFPFSLRRETFFVEEKFVQLQYDDSFSNKIAGVVNNKIVIRDRPKSINEIRVGVDLDILFLHKLSIDLRLMYVNNSENIEKGTTIFSVGNSF